MAVSTLTVATAKLHLLQTSKPKPFIPFITFRTPVRASSSSASRVKQILSLESISATKSRLLDLGVGLLAASVMLFSSLDANATRIEYFATVGEPLCELNFSRSGLGYCDVVLGTGDEAPRGELINVHYTARFADGRVFDSSYKRARPLTMRIGVGKVIKGLDQGILGGEGVPPCMLVRILWNRECGKRKLRIPPELAYGPEPAGCFSGDCNVPANATLLYDINFVGVYK